MMALSYRYRDTIIAAVAASVFAIAAAWAQTDPSPVFLGLKVTGLTGFMYANGSSAVSASTTVPLSDISGLGTNVATAAGNAANAANGLLQLNASGTVPQANLTGGAGTQSTVSAPTAPASTSAYKMQGLAGTITPATSGNVTITISGTIISPTGALAGDGISYQLSEGISTAPSNGAALTGTQIGVPQAASLEVAATAAADVSIPFSLSYRVTGLTVGTPVWIDLAAKSLTTASDIGLSNVSIVAIEK